MAKTIKGRNPPKIKKMKTKKKKKNRIKQNKYERKEEKQEEEEEGNCVLVKEKKITATFFLPSAIFQKTINLPIIYAQQQKENKALLNYER